MAEHEGILFIGDPHAASKIIGFRKDDYPLTVLEKLGWCLKYADQNRYLPVCLGDLFHHPRDNANWLLSDLILRLSRCELYGIYGNHDVREGDLTEDDSLSILVNAGVYRLLKPNAPWRGSIGGKQIAIYGSSWNTGITGVVRDPKDDLVILLTHHDISFPDYEGAKIDTAELEGVDIVVNGHIHRKLEKRRIGRTLWVNPGNISRVNRSDASRQALPSVLLLTMGDEGPDLKWVTVPHKPYRQVFHEMEGGGDVVSDSVFIQGLAELQSRRTETGAGLRHFLDANLHQFETAVRSEIESLAEEALRS